MNARLIDWIWQIRGNVALDPRQSNEDVFDRLDPLFRESGTSHERGGDTLTFRKKDQAAQDVMSVFDGGVLRIEEAAAARVLRYQLTSRILLFCFLAPLMFLALAPVMILVGQHQKSVAEATRKAEKAAGKKPVKKKAEVPMNPLDKALGAPAPEKKKEGAKEDDDKYLKPTSAYVFAAIFALLYVVGRILEARLVKRQFRRRLRGTEDAAAPGGSAEPGGRATARAGSGTVP